MGVDVTTWRARVGMFTQRTSQKSLLIFRAQNKRRSPNNSQAPGSMKQCTTPGSPTSIRETGTIQQDEYKPNPTQPANKAYSHVAWISFSYICHLILLLSVSLIDPPSELRLPSSYAPGLLNPDRNATSPLQLSYVQSLIILKCGDVEDNPGPLNPGCPNPGPPNPGPPNPGPPNPRPTNPGPSNPGPPNPGPPNPGPQNPGPPNPGPPNPGPSNPGPPNPGPQNSGPPNPCSLNPGPPNPGPPNPGPPNPGPPNPGPQNPGPPNPGPLNPGPQNPGPPNPGPLNPGPPNPGPLNPGPPNPGPPNPGPLNPGPLNPGPLNPGPLNPGPTNPGPPNPGPLNPGPPNPHPPNPHPPNPGPLNPGPPNKLTYEESAEELTKLTVPVEDVIYPEYCCNINVDLTLKKKDLSYLKQMEDIVQTACAMLNYAGGVITLNPQTASTDKDLDEWIGKVRQQLDLVVPQEVSRCIEMNIQSGYIEMWVTKSWMFITYKSHLYTRRDAATIDREVTMISDGVDTKPAFVSKVIGIQWNQLNQGDPFPLSECKNLEFKCYKSTSDATTLMDKIINDKKGGEPILIRTLLAFTNTPGGGDAIIGIKEDAHGAPILEGQKLSAADEGEVQRRFDELMIQGLNGQQRIWPSTPQSGSEWTIKFYPLRNCPGNNRNVLIHIRVNQVAGYVLGDEPEAYTMTLEGNIRHVPLNEWKNCIKKKSNQSPPDLIKLGGQREKQDTDEDDLDEEQFKQLINDLKQHRVTLSLKHIKSASWTKDSEDSQDDLVPGVNMETCVEEVSKSDLLKPSSPSTWVPEKTILDRWVTNTHPEMTDCVNAIAQSHSHDAVVIGSKSFGHIFPRLSLEVPQNHAFDLLALQGNAELDLWIVFDDCVDIVTCKKYTNSAIRMLRSELLSYIHQHTDIQAVKIAITAKVWSIADNCVKYVTTADYTESTVELPILQKAVAYCLLQGQSHIKNRLGEEFLTTLTKDQLSAYLHYDYMPIMVFQGPPGSGKSIIAQHLCEQEAHKRNLRKDKILYISPCQPLAEFMKFQQLCDVKFTTTDRLVHTIREALANGILLIIVDDAHLFQCSKPDWTRILDLFKPVQDRKSSAEIHLAVFLDPEYQNFRGDKTRNLEDAISDFNKAHPFSKVSDREPFRKMFRNSWNIFDFFKMNAEKDAFSLTCSHDFQGDGVSVIYTLENFFREDRSNPVLKITEDIVGTYNFEENFTYQMTDITILVDSNGKGEAAKEVQRLIRIFHNFYPEAKVQRASHFPIQGMVIEELKSFSGLDTRVCILVLTCKNTSVMSNPRYKCFVASRGITKLVFLLHGDIVDSSFKQLKFSEEQECQKLTKQLLQKISEEGTSKRWLRTNVPDTECWQKTKPVVMLRCQQQIQSGDFTSDWMDTNIPPALRRESQFVRALIGFVCQRTIRSTKPSKPSTKGLPGSQRKTPSGYNVHLTHLRSFLISLNCLYGAPESLQHQALDLVYDHVRTLQNTENVLQQVLHIMWSDGYISRQVMLSWCDNMEQTKRQACEINLQGKDLREQIQERMRARQEVRRWMEDSTQMGGHWYILPHYQRVTLHALCQLAVTWQGDKCTVDKELLFHYIPQLYCDTSNGLQLLYAVQCVLYHLQNPPGLAVAVFQALLTISRADKKYKPVITPTDWDKWRNTQNPLYDEGRNIIIQQGQILDLIVLASGKVKHNQINDWICKIIPEDKILDAFIIASVCCLINRGEEVTLVRDWISQNVPQSMQTAVQDTLTTRIIEICVWSIQYRDYWRLLTWVDRLLLLAWRQDTLFVRVFIKALCPRTLYSDGINSKDLRWSLASSSCLYGASEAFQLQVLDSVYDHVRTLKHHENSLQEVLDIMWSDGYISKQTILSWCGNMEQTSAIKFQGILTGSKKNLGEQIQKRMRARQEVREWMRNTTQMGYYWDDSPHYQRVALHALCQLAVTWQDDKCTVDKHLLFHYIPQLYCDTTYGLQLLYAVQCVLHNLQNPPGLAVAVLQALRTISILDTEDKPLISTTNWDKWKNTQNPLYDEGRNIIMQQGQILDLMVLVSSKVTLTEINDWICENIPQDRMLDAFITTAVSLINRGEELTLIRDWISQNVPQSMMTVVQDTLKSIIIERCVQRIQYKNYWIVVDWTNRHILPAWRQDAQFVRAVIKAVCQRTIHSVGVDSTELRHYLGALNCLYGASEALQLQALDYVYDHFRTLQHHEKFLQEVLDIMWYDGYISKQTILSWCGNMVQTSAIKFQGILMGSKKDLLEQIQKRMRTRQEVWQWMGDNTQMGYYWDDSPHYQRVALHALCQLAVTWHGDKCTVDKDLLFHYIPQLFCYTRDGLQLLYAVQCMLHHLQNPPGLAVAVLQALVSPLQAGTSSDWATAGKSVITKSDVEKWRETEHPVYEEGRELLIAIESLNI